MALYIIWVSHFVGFLLQNHLPAGDSFNEENQVNEFLAAQEGEEVGFS